MAGGYVWSRRIGSRARTLRSLVRETQRGLQDVSEILPIDPEISPTLNEISLQWTLGTALVVLGSDVTARVRLVHALLGTKILPEELPRGCRWIRIQYGSIKQVHLSLGNSEFELVEDMECNTGPWDTIPLKDLIRQGPADISTIVEVEINNQFLKDGLQIIIPPDINTEPQTSDLKTLQNQHAEFYTKRQSIFKTFHPVYLYAVNKMGKYIFGDNICDEIVVPKADDDFWSTYGFFNMNQSVCEDVEEGRERKEWRGWGGPAVFDVENCLDLHQLKQLNSHAQLLFILFSDAVEDPASSRVEEEATESCEDRIPWSEELPESDRELVDDGNNQPSELANTDPKSLNEEHIAFMNELIDQWELMTSPPQKHYVKSQWMILNDKEVLRTVDHTAHNTSATNPHKTTNSTCAKSRTEKTVDSRTTLLNIVVKYATDVMQSYLLEDFTRLSEIHVKLTQQFILASFDMARELQVVPKKIQYVAIQEQHLYESIHEKFHRGDKQQELVVLMQAVLQDMKREVAEMDWSVDDLPWHRSPGAPPPAPPPRAASPPPEPCDDCLQEYELITSWDDSYREFFTCTQEVPSPPETVPVSTESGSISWSSLFLSEDRGLHGQCRASVSLRHATLDVQETVLTRLSRKISLKLVDFVDCLKETYFGTLQRCLWSLEASACAAAGCAASDAMRQLLRATAAVQLQPHAAFSFLHRLLHSLRISSGVESGCCPLSAAWRRKTALRVTHSLSAHRLAKIISQQILERLSSAHEKYQSALLSLETALENRLHHTEDIKLAIRRKYAPLFARFCLESTAMRDVLMYGMPDLGREIGRGQYGVVYAVRGGWGGRSPLAAKSVLPQDNRHYHNLAMEFFYTRSIPPHPRIVPLVGCVSRARGVLLLAERRARDLHTAVRAGLRLTHRMAIACDIMEGIRYLHSLGLLHRDIKLQNVLLDAGGRASLSDLGFCAARGLLSGSLVGTPVHMAPELLRGDYGPSVDVYAFGILFWYLCAGDVRLPAAFETFNNKEQLWSKVKKGVRPERLPHFSDRWWDVMTSCWCEPPQRALPGQLLTTLQHIRNTTTDDEDCL